MPAVFTVTPEDLPLQILKHCARVKTLFYSLPTRRCCQFNNLTVLYCGLIGRGEYLTFIIMGRTKLRTFFAGVLRALP